MRQWCSIRRTRQEREAGFTLIELVIAITIMGAIGSVVTGAFIVGMQSTERVQQRLPGARSVNNLTMYLTADIASATSGTDSTALDTVPSETSGCQQEPAGTINVVRIRSEDPADPTSAYFASYRYEPPSGSIPTGRLWRVFCRAGEPASDQHVVAEKISADAVPAFSISELGDSASLNFDVVSKGLRTPVYVRGAIRTSGVKPQLVTDPGTPPAQHPGCAVVGGEVGKATKTGQGTTPLVAAVSIEIVTNASLGGRCSALVATVPGRSDVDCVLKQNAPDRWSGSCFDPSGGGLWPASPTSYRIVIVDRVSNEDQAPVKEVLDIALAADPPLTLFVTTPPPPATTTTSTTTTTRPPTTSTSTSTTTTTSTVVSTTTTSTVVPTTTTTTTTTTSTPSTSTTTTTTMPTGTTSTSTTVPATTSTSTTTTAPSAGPRVVITSPRDATYLAGTSATITVDATAGAAPIASVLIQRAVADSENWLTVCTDTTAPYSCSWTLPADGDYDLRAVATDTDNLKATSDVVSVAIDTTAPTAVMSDPGTPLRGTVLLSATATEPSTSVGSVQIQRSLAGAGTWVTVCTLEQAPYSCYFDSGAFANFTSLDFRAVAYDLGGNSGVSNIVLKRIVDNSVSSVTLLDPGKYLSGAVPFSIATTSRQGLTSLNVQYTPAGTTKWVFATDCSFGSSPVASTQTFSCSWNSTVAADGQYDFRAVLVDGTGSTIVSATVALRVVDNLPLRGADVQSVNGGYTLTKPEPNDVMTFTYNGVVLPESLITGWNGTARTVVIRMRDGGVLSPKLTGTDDTLDVYTSSALDTLVNIGSVNLHGDYVKKNKTMYFWATLTQGTTSLDGKVVSTLTLRFGSLASGGSMRTPGTKGTMVWTPSILAADAPGNRCSAIPVTETGILDIDF